MGIYRSRISVLMLLVIALVFIPLIYNSIKTGVVAILVTDFCLLFFCLFILMGIKYRIQGSTLQIKFWSLVIGTVDIMSVGLIKRSYNPLSAPAVSLKRLSIYTKGRLFALISPAKEDVFLNEIREINPGIEILVKEEKRKFRIWDWDI